MADNVARVVLEGLCTACGACLVVCPRHALVMRETPVGLLHPFVTEALCTNCGRCWRVCAGRRLDTSLPVGLDPFKGTVLDAYVGHATDDDLRRHGQSGGVVGALVAFMIESGAADGALSTILADDQDVRPSAIVARTRKAVVAGQRSKYCPSASIGAVRACGRDERLVTVAVPCQVHGLQNLACGHSGVVPEEVLRIGLFCEGVLSFNAIDLMASLCGLEMKDVIGLEYKSKSRAGWPGEICFHMNDGRSEYASSSIRMLLKDFMTPLRCRVCFDKLNMLADLSVGDPWGVPGASPEGESVILVRTERGRLALELAIAEGCLIVGPASPDAVFFGQAVEQRRRDFATYRKMWRQGGLALPSVEGLDCWLSGKVPFSDTIRCQYRVYASRYVCRASSKSQALGRARSLVRTRRTVSAPFRFVAWFWSRLSYRASRVFDR